MAPLSPAERHWDSGGAGRRPAAVLLLFVVPAAPGGPARILFMRRSTKVGSHKGQIGLAGGRAETVDASPAATALRELDEELGVPPQLVTIAGMLPPVAALDGGEVRTVVGVTALDLGRLTLAADEVDYVFAAPWRLFAADRAQGFSFNIFGNWRASKLFESEGGPIWGLTAQILLLADFG